MRNTKLFTFLLLAMSLLFLSCHSSDDVLKEGDLLFQDLDCGDLCDAIEAVTIGVNGKDFSHCAMVVKINDSLKVIEAIGDYVQINSIDIFFKRSGDTADITNITVARLKDKNKHLISKASSQAIAYLGEPYDKEFLMDNGALYCSELLYEAYKKANDGNDFFTLSPMTYKVPETESFFPAWVDYYNELNKPIPEGLLGINPGSISRSPKLKTIEINTIK